MRDKVAPPSDSQTPLHVPILAKSASYSQSCGPTSPWRAPACRHGRKAFYAWRRSLRDEAINRSYSDCAVVGASGNLLLGSLGADIDQHDAVFRLNHAPVESYKVAVGSKTTVRIMTMDEYATDRSYPRRQGGAWRNHSEVALGTHIIISCHRPFDGRCVPWRIEHLFAKRDRLIGAHLLGPTIVNAAKMRYEGQTRQRSPTAGALAIEVALASCRRVSVYGFISARCAHPCYHYYDCTYSEAHFVSSRRATNGYHDFAALMASLQKMHCDGLVTLRPASCAPTAIQCNR